MDQYFIASSSSVKLENKAHNTFGGPSDRGDSSHQFNLFVQP